MRRVAAACILVILALPGSAYAAGRLKMDDKASVWSRTGSSEKFDFTNRVGKSMSTLAPGLDSGYFMRCLEEIANIGDTKELTMSDMVRTCVSLQGNRTAGGGE